MQCRIGEEVSLVISILNLHMNFHVLVIQGDGRCPECLYGAVGTVRVGADGVGMDGVGADGIGADASDPNVV
jgi:hypothetical protein